GVRTCQAEKSSSVFEISKVGTALSADWMRPSREASIREGRCGLFDLAVLVRFELGFLRFEFAEADLSAAFELVDFAAELVLPASRQPSPRLADGALHGVEDSLPGVLDRRLGGNLSRRASRIDFFVHTGLLSADGYEQPLCREIPLSECGREELDRVS